MNFNVFYCSAICDFKCCTVNTDIIQMTICPLYMGNVPYLLILFISKSRNIFFHYPH